MKFFKVLDNILLFLALSLHAGCGDNVFVEVEESDPGHQAVVLIEDDRPSAAIKLLLNTLGSDFRSIYNAVDEASSLPAVQEALSTEIDALVAAGAVQRVPNLVSILASAQAKLFGVDFLELALKLATNDSDSAETAEGESNQTGEGQAITKLFPVLPDANSQNIRGLELATTLLDAIGSATLTKQDFFKKSILNVATTSLISKSIDVDGDGVISAIEAQELSDANAEAFLSQLISASSAAGSSGESGQDTNAGKSADNISGILAQVNGQEGTTNAEKVRNYLAASSEEATE